MLRSTLFSVISAAAILLPATAFAGATGTISGTFEAPVLSGNIINTNTTLSFLDNTATAVYSGVGTNSLSWGDGAYPAPNASTLTFVGKAYNVGLYTPFDLGTLTYTNGTSDTTSLIFGATLAFDTGNVALTGLNEPISITTTTNTRISQIRDADYISLADLPGLYLGAFEGQTVNFELYGEFILDPQLVLDFALLPGQQPGIINTSPGIPEPTSWAMMLAGLLAVSLRLRRRALSAA